jgi:hypothetical protein
MKFFAHGLGPQILEQWLLHQLPVLRDGLLGDRMDNAATVFINVNDQGILVGMLGE